MAPQVPSTGQPQFKNQRSPDFDSLYANNFAFESSVWDLKLTFGELDQALGVIDQHTAITIPWTGAKLLVYYLMTNVAAQEIINGKIQIPPAIIPAEPPPIPEDHKDDPVFHKVFEKFKELHAEFLKDM
jgi:hypothetical protein